MRNAVKPLRWIFWGGMICLFDLTYSQISNGTGFRLDLLDDFIGMALVTGGLIHPPPPGSPTPWGGEEWRHGGGCHAVALAKAGFGVVSAIENQEAPPLAAGRIHLGRLGLKARHPIGFPFTLTVAVLSTVDAFIGHFIFQEPGPLIGFQMVLGLVELEAILIFCRMMTRFAGECGLSEASRSWKTTTWLFIFRVFSILSG